MPDPHNKKPKDILSELRERLKEVGLQPLMIKIIDGKLALDTKKDFLTLPSKIRDKAFRAVQTKLKRPTLKLVKSIAKYLKEALELEAELDDSKGGPATASRPPPGGPRGIWTEFPSDLQPQESSGVGPETAEEFLAYYEDFLSKNLGKFKFSDEMKRELAERAVSLKDELQFEYGLSSEEVAGLTKMSFYDIFFLCDNSGSMKFGNKISALNKTLQSVSFWATKIEPSGISLRFLNHARDDREQFNFLTDADQIDDLIADVNPRGPSRLGTMLRNKIIQPLEKRAKGSDGKIKPRIIIIITDGGPTREDPDCLREAILNAKTNGLGAHFGPAVTIFLLAKVGQDEEATLFLDELSEDEDLSSMLYTFNKDLGEVRDILAKKVGEGDEKGERAYRTLWMRLFNACMNSQTD